MDELEELLADVECLYWSTDNAHDRLDLLKDLREKVDELKGCKSGGGGMCMQGVA